MITCSFENGNKANLRHVVVHAIVEMDGKLLLEKRTGDLLESGKWSLPSGYLDREETAGEGIVREVKEETKLRGEVGRHIVTFDEIKENEFNLNIPRYVDTFVEEDEVDIAAVQLEIEKLEDELMVVQNEMAKYLREL